MSYLTQYAAAREVNFLQRLEMAIVQVARDVIAEPRDTANHYNRVILATQALRDAGTWAKLFSDAIATQNIVDATSTDGDFFSAVNFYWNGFSGITYNGALV